MEWFLCDRDLRHERVNFENIQHINLQQYPPELFYKKVVLKSFEHFTEKHQQWGLF